MNIQELENLGEQVRRFTSTDNDALRLLREHAGILPATMVDRINGIIDSEDPGFEVSERLSAIQNLVNP